MSEAERVELLRRFKSGDDDALQALLLGYCAPLRRIIADRIDARLRRTIDEEDVLQQVLADAFRGIERLRQARFDGPGGLYKWLESAALARVADARRSSRRAKRDVRRAEALSGLLEKLTGADSRPSGALRREEQRSALVTALARLGDEQRAVMELRFLQGLPVEEVAARLGKSKGAVNALCHRGLKALRAYLGQASAFRSRA